MIFEKFSGGYRPPYWGGAMAPLPSPYPLGAPALRASLGTFGQSIDASACPPNEKIVPAPLAKDFTSQLTEPMNQLKTVYFYRAIKYVLWIFVGERPDSTSETETERQYSLKNGIICSLNLSADESGQTTNSAMYLIRCYRVKFAWLNSVQVFVSSCRTSGIKMVLKVLQHVISENFVTWARKSPERTRLRYRKMENCVANCDHFRTCTFNSVNSGTI